MKNQPFFKLGIAALLLSALFATACGDGEVCDCCSSKSDCEFGLKCVDLIGGSGKSDDFATIFDSRVGKLWGIRWRLSGRDG